MSQSTTTETSDTDAQDTSDDLERVTITNRSDLVAAAHDDPYNSFWELDGVSINDIFDFTVVHEDESLSWTESYIGGTLGTVVDYGEHWDLSDEELIQTVVEDWDNGLKPQFLGFMDNDKETVAETVLIVRKENGYSKLPKLETPDEA